MTVADRSLPQTETTPLPLKSDHATLTRHGPNQFEVKCNQVRTIAAKQREHNWCWAACTEMLFRYYGADITQEELVKILGKEAKPGESSQPAEQMELCIAMNPDLIPELNRREAIIQQSSNPNTIEINALSWNFVNLGNVIDSFSELPSDVAVQEISLANPLVMGYTPKVRSGEGHIVLIYGVEYSRLKPEGEAKYRDFDPLFSLFSKQFAISKFLIIDPQPGPDGNQLTEMTADALKNEIKVDFMLGKAQARKKLVGYMKAFHATPDEIRSGAR